MSTALYIYSAKLIVESARQEKVLGLPLGVEKSDLLWSLAES